VTRVEYLVEFLIFDEQQRIDDERRNILEPLERGTDRPVLVERNPARIVQRETSGDGLMIGRRYAQPCKGRNLS